MAVTREIEKQTVRLKLNNGVSPSGVTKTVNVSLPTLTTANADYSDDKVMDVIGYLIPCLTKSLSAVEYVGTYLLID